MKTAIVCDWLVTYAGAERVLQEMLLCFPNADLFAIIDFFSPSDRKILLHKKVTTSFIQKLPFAKKYYRHYLPLMPLAIEQLDVSAYDLVISSSHAVAKGVLTHHDQVHVSYVFTPIRYAWDLQHQYLKESKLDKGLKGLITRQILQKIRIWDQRNATQVDYFIAISNFIAKRIYKAYRRESTVIYPPVDTKLFILHEKKENFYLTASRFVPYKKIDLIVECFSHMPDKRLIVIGDGPDMTKIKAKATPNITILGFKPTSDLIYYMQRAKAFIFAAIEDFGIIPLEAQSCGTPVIALRKGAATETIHDKTGIFFEEQTVPSLTDAIYRFEKEEARFIPKECALNAEKFSIAKFRESFSHFINECMLKSKK